MTPKKLGIFICLYSGMRLGEICALQWSDIDINLKVFHVRRTVQRIYLKGQEHASKIIIGTPKTQTAVRDIPIPTHLWKILCKKKKQFGKNFCIISDQDKVFLDPRTYQINYKKYLTQCGLPYRNFHALRHPYVKPTTKKYLFFLVPMIQLS
nr:site-specific integrase [Catenibacillus scindens]